MTTVSGEERDLFEYRIVLPLTMAEFECGYTYTCAKAAAVENEVCGDVVM